VTFKNHPLAKNLKTPPETALAAFFIPSQLPHFFAEEQIKLIVEAIVRAICPGWEKAIHENRPGNYPCRDQKGAAPSWCCPW
jgi:hypothetical protein